MIQNSATIERPNSRTKRRRSQSTAVARQFKGWIWGDLLGNTVVGQRREISVAGQRIEAATCRSFQSRPPAGITSPENYSPQVGQEPASLSQFRCFPEFRHEAPDQTCQSCRSIVATAHSQGFADSQVLLVSIDRLRLRHVATVAHAPIDQRPHRTPTVGAVDRLPTHRQFRQEMDHQEHLNPQSPSHWPSTFQQDSKIWFPAGEQVALAGK
jgi:hypothetical protein